MEGGLSGSCGSFGLPISQPNERDKPDKPVLVSANKIDQIDQTHEINQFRFAGLDQQSLLRQKSYARGLRIDGR
jgi:hypothetical protein